MASKKWSPAQSAPDFSEVDDDYDEDDEYCHCGAFHDADELDGVCKCCGLSVDPNDGT
jgi:hypothetical protein